MIREANELDLQDILYIYNDAIIHTTSVYHYLPHTLEQRLQWYNQKLQDGYPVMVYEEDGKAVGFATYGPFRNWPAYKYTIEHSVYVHPDYRKRGIASSLLQELIRLANEQQYAVMIAGIDESNQGSIRLHEKLGFTYSGKIEKAGYKFQRWLNLCFYQYELTGPVCPQEG